MKNEPRIEIQYLVDFELEFIPDLKNSLGESNLLSNPQNLNDDIAVNGFKGFHLSGGSKDSNGKDIGCLLDGSYKFYDPVIKYNGLLGNENSIKSGNANVFTTPQKIDIETMYENTYLKSLLIYFDKDCNEYATKLRFNNAVETNKIMVNNKLLFMRSFGEDSTLTSTNVELLEWSKENSLAKIVKIKTGFTGIYTPMQIRDLFYSNDKFSDENQLRFGVSLQTANISLYDKDGSIMALYEARLFFKNIRVLIYIDNIIEADLLLDTKSSNNTINYWEFDCKDILSYKLDEKLPIMGVQVDGSGNPIPKSLKYMLDYTLAGVSNPVIYDNGLESELDSIMIPVAFIRPNQTRYDLLLKIAQVGLLRIYTDANANIVISRGL
jgi:hypothetical protein